MSTIFDSHCHPQMAQYDKDRDEMIKRATQAGVFMICVGTDYETSKQGIELAREHKNMWATVGLHPNDAEVSGIEYLVSGEFEKLVDNPRVIAIGEVGIDYYRTTDASRQEKQREIFGKFVELALKKNKPIIIHGRDAGKGSTGQAHNDIIEILNTRYSIQDTNLRGVAHSFTGNIEDARKYLDLGFSLGFNGIITFARQYDEVVKYVPLENILLETDAPYLTPEPYRTRPPAFAERFGGRVRNEPSHVIEVAKKLAEIKEELLEKIIEQTSDNCRKLFNIYP